MIALGGQGIGAVPFAGLGQSEGGAVKRMIVGQGDEILGAHRGRQDHGQEQAAYKRTQGCHRDGRSRIPINVMIGPGYLNRQPSTVTCRA